MLVVFTVGGRAQYLRETLDSWRNVRGVENTTLMFFVEPNADEAAEVCMSVDFAGGAVTMLNEHRFGVLRNPHHALTHAFNASVHADFVILAEEDVPVSTDTLEFFEWTSENYRDDKQTAAVCGHQITIPLGSVNTVYRNEWFSPVLWGTWRDRWEDWIRDNWDFDYSYGGWDQHFQDVMQSRGQVVVHPAVSRSQHIGALFGAHCTPAFFPQTVSKSFQMDILPQIYAEDELLNGDTVCS